MSTENTTALKNFVMPVAVKYGTMRIFLFGSKARGSADENSDSVRFLKSKKYYSDDSIDISELVV